MTSVSRIDVLTAELPFRFSFGHALAERRSSTNVFVRIAPRRRHASATARACRASTSRARRSRARSRRSPSGSPRRSSGAAIDATPDERRLADAIESAGRRARRLARHRARCALELALLDACGQALRPVGAHWLGAAPAADRALRRRAPVLVAAQARRARARHPGDSAIRQVKIKVGDDLETRARIAAHPPPRARRTTSTCGSTRTAPGRADEALDAIERMRPYRVSAVEQPVAGDDLEGLAPGRPPESPRRSSWTSRCARSRRPRQLAATARVRRVQHPRLQVRRAARLGRASRGSPPRPASSASSAPRSGRAASSPPPAGTSPPRSAPRYLEGSGGRLLLKEDVTERTSCPAAAGERDAYRRARARRRRPARGARECWQPSHAVLRGGGGEGVSAVAVSKGRVRSSTVQRLLRTWLKFSAANHFDDATWDPRAAQEKKLLEICRAQRQSTEYGREHGFERVQSIARLPAKPSRQNTYETPRAVHRRACSTARTDVLTADEPLMFATTSGTTGKAKYIPVTPSYLHEYSHGVHVHTYRMFTDFRRHPRREDPRPVEQRRRGPHGRRAALRRDLRLPARRRSRSRSSASTPCRTSSAR